MPRGKPHTRQPSVLCSAAPASLNSKKTMPPPPPSEPAAHGRASSSSACSTTAPRRRTTVGCMAGLLRLFSPYHRSHHRKRLTAKSNSANKHKQPPPPPPSSSPSPVFLSPMKPKPTQQPAVTRRRRSCDAPRSPTIAAEHRRRASCDSPRPPSPPAIVARLMGLEESAPPSPATTTARPVVVPTRPPPPPPPPPQQQQQQPETAAEKRRKLLGALEKCDEDLKTLRRIIAAVRAAEMRAAAASSDVAITIPAGRTTPPANNKGSSANRWVVGGRHEQSPPSPSPSPQNNNNNNSKARGDEKEKEQQWYQYPSPDSVLDAIVSSPRFPCRKRPSPCSTDLDAAVPTAAAGTANKVVKPSRTFVFSSGDYCKISRTGDELHAAVVGVHHHPPVAAALFHPRLPRAESWRHHRRRWELEAAAAGRVISRAMAESAGEVMWGQQQQAGGASADEQRRECGRVAAALERAILHDLVCDVVSELLAQSGVIYSHGHGAAGCRKRLCF